MLRNLYYNMLHDYDLNNKITNICISSVHTKFKYLSKTTLVNFALIR